MKTIDCCLGHLVNKATRLTTQHLYYRVSKTTPTRHPTGIAPPTRHKKINSITRNNTTKLPPNRKSQKHSRRKLNRMPHTKQHNTVTRRTISGTSVQTCVQINVQASTLTDVWTYRPDDNERTNVAYNGQLRGDKQ